MKVAFILLIFTLASCKNLSVSNMATEPIPPSITMEDISESLEGETLPDPGVYLNQQVSPLTGGCPVDERDDGNSFPTFVPAEPNKPPFLASEPVIPIFSPFDSWNSPVKLKTNLTKRRSLVNLDAVDKCDPDNAQKDQFGGQINYHISKMSRPTPAKIGGVGSLFGVSNGDNLSVSLLSNPICENTAESLGAMIKKVPDQRVIDKLNRFSKEMNSLRESALSGNTLMRDQANQLWSKFFSCLAYTESLSSADSKSSTDVAKKYKPTDYQHPSGVQFYEDPLQDEDSRLNIGLFQFTPTARGNINPCLKAWNEMHAGNSQCQLPLNGTQADMIKIVGSSQQSFNAFCGVHKIIQTFTVQAHTTDADRTHPSNRSGNGLKPAAQRCVSPFIQSGKGYNHFGPLMNSVGNNMNVVFSCMERKF
jgi:hypothetical protein